MTCSYWNGGSVYINRIKPIRVLIIEKSKLNLMDTIYENDKSPLMDNCDCYACKHFTKGYLHHLFNCHELLGVILL